MASFTLYLRTRDALFARTGGTLPDAKGCYFAVDYHETARWALENGIRRVHYGMAAYEAKVTRGCELRPRWGWFAFPARRPTRIARCSNSSRKASSASCASSETPQRSFPPGMHVTSSSGARQ